MKLIDALRNVDKSEQNSTFPDLRGFCDILSVDNYNGWSDKFNERMKGYYVQKWLCTDTWVGLVAYYFDDELVAASYQPARKSDTRYELISNDAAYKVRDFLISIIEYEAPSFYLIDINEEIEATYSCEYGQQLLIKSGFYNGIPCSFKKLVPDTHHLYQEIEIEFEDGSTKIIATNEFKMLLCLKSEGGSQ